MVHVNSALKLAQHDTFTQRNTSRRSAATVPADSAKSQSTAPSTTGASANTAADDFRALFTHPLTASTPTPGALPYDPAKLTGVGPYGSNASANYTYWLNNPGVPGNPLTPEQQAVNPVGRPNLAAANTNPYTPFLTDLGDQPGIGPPQGNISAPGYGQPIISYYGGQQFASPGTVRSMLAWLGPGYTSGSAPIVPADSGSPFHFPSGATITDPNGNVASAGLLASYFGAFGNSPSYLKQMLASAFGSPSPNSANQNLSSILGPTADQRASQGIAPNGVNRTT